MSIKLNQNMDLPLSKKEEKAEQKVGLLQRDIQLFGGGFGDKKKESFFSDLRTLLLAGVDLKSSLEIIIEEQPKKKEKELFLGIYEDIMRGKSLAMSMKDSGQFSDYEYYSVEIGEESNRLHAVLEELIRFYAGRAALKKQIYSVLSYPLFVLMITIGLVYFMMNNVVPMFADVYKQFGSDLPPLTKRIVNISNHFPTYMMVFGGVVIGLFIFINTQKKQEWFRKSISTVALRIPKVKSLVQMTYLARFTQSMHLLLSSKTPLVKSLELTRKMIKFYPLEQAIDQIVKDVAKGKSLHEGMAAFSIFPSRMISLIKVGESVNQLEPMLEKLSRQYNEDLKHQTTIIGKIMEPMIILIIGIVVGIILVAMYMPMFNMSNIIAQ
ncbi:MAG: type II secretion system F family protein [Flavobacteriales bacterium]|nr:type II secretion system F family protein [Flavobacteriales bacterium]